MAAISTSQGPRCHRRRICKCKAGRDLNSCHLYSQKLKTIGSSTLLIQSSAKSLSSQLSGFNTIRGFSASDASFKYSPLAAVSHTVAWRPVALQKLRLNGMAPWVCQICSGARDEMSGRSLASHDPASGFCLHRIDGSVVIAVWNIASGNQSREESDSSSKCRHLFHRVCRWFQNNERHHDL